MDCYSVLEHNNNEYYVMW